MKIKIQTQLRGVGNSVLNRTLSTITKTIGWAITRAFLLAIPVLFAYAVFEGGESGLVAAGMVVCYELHVFGKKR